MQVARAIKDDWPHANALSSVAEGQARLGRTAEAVAIALNVADASERARALVAIAEEHIKAKRIVEAGDVLELALQSASLIETRADNLALLRNSLLVAVANTQVKAGLTKEASITLERIVHNALSVKLAVDQSSVLYFSQPCFRGNERPRTDESSGIFIFDRETLVVQSTVMDAASRSCGMNHFAKAHAQAGLKQEAIALFDQALQAAQSIENDWSRAQALRDIVKTEAESGLVTYSATVLKQTLQGALSITYAELRADALYAIAMALPN